MSLAYIGSMEIPPAGRRLKGLWGLSITPTYPWAIISLLMGCVIVTGRMMPRWLSTDVDVLWHVRAGQYVLSHGPASREMWLWPLLGHPLVHHEWLSQVIIALTYQTGGLELLYGLAVAVLVGICAMMSARMADEGPKPQVLFAGGALITMLVISHFHARPHLADWVGVALTMRGLEKVWAPGRRGNAATLAVWAMGYSLWMNAHSGAPYGVALIIASMGWYSLSTLLSGKKIKLPGTPIACALAGALLGTLITPFHVHGWTHAMSTGADPVFRIVIGEFRPLQGPMSAGSLGAFSITLIVLVIANIHRITPWKQGVVLAAVIAATISIRHVSLLSIVSAWTIFPAILPRSEDYAATWRATRRKTLLLSLGATMAVIALCVVSQKTGGKLPMGRWSTEPRPEMGTEALWHSISTGSTRSYSSYPQGTVTHWLNPSYPTFIDSRGDAVGGAYIKDSEEISRAVPGWEDVARKYRLDQITASRANPSFNALQNNPEWTAVYCDEWAGVFRKAKKTSSCQEMGDPLKPLYLTPLGKGR